MTQFAVPLERVVAAPRAAVSRAWLDPEVLARWTGPDGFSVATATVDERPGGVHRVDMLDAEGRAHTYESVIDELVPDERIVRTFRFHPDSRGHAADDRPPRRHRRRHGAAALAPADHARRADRPGLRRRRLGSGAGHVASAVPRSTTTTTTTITTRRSTP